MSEEKSEFGSGVIVCLAKFSEHLGNEHARTIANAIHLMKLPAEKRTETIEKGDTEYKRAARKLQIYNEIAEGDDTLGLSEMIMLWMNGASDHFYELDKERAPQPLRELAALTLRIGHGHTTETWTENTVKEIYRLWQETCLAVDRQLGVEKPDWGQW